MVNHHVPIEIPASGWYNYPFSDKPKYHSKLGSATSHQISKKQWFLFPMIHQYRVLPQNRSSSAPLPSAIRELLAGWWFGT